MPQEQSTILLAKNQSGSEQDISEEVTPTDQVFVDGRQVQNAIVTVVFDSIQISFR